MSHAQRIELLPVCIIGKDTLNENEIFGEVTDLTISSNYIYVLDNKFSRVQKYDKSGKYLSSVGKKGEGPGEFGTDLRSISTDEKGNIIVGGMRKIYIFEESGSFMRSFTVDFQMNDLCVDREDKILALGYKKDKIIHAYNQEGKYLFSFGEPFEAPLNFYKYKHFPVVKMPFKIFCTGSGKVYFVNPYKFEIYIYKNYDFDKKIEHHSNFFRPSWLLEHRGGFSLMCMSYAIFEQNDLLYVSLFDGEKGKSELILFRNDKFSTSLKLDDFPVEIDSEGYLYSINNSETPHITKSIIKLASHDLGP